MPVSHIGLTVSHLPISCSFFLAALSPLGYRYIGQDNSQIGFGIDEADFFICQETPGNEAGAAHVAFSAPSRTAVDTFFTSALKAGGRIHGEPAVRDRATGYYSAAVLDLDGNSIEVVHRTEANMRAHTPSTGHPEGSRVLSWQKEVARSTGDESRQQAERQSTTRTIVNNIATTPTVYITHPPPLERQTSGEMSAKALIGTLLGAAAGAAVAYAMTKGEAQSAPRLEAAPITTSFYQAIEAAPSTTARSQKHSSHSHSHTPPPASTASHRTNSTQPRPPAIAAPSPPSTLITTFVPPSEIPRPQPASLIPAAKPASSHPRSSISRSASATKTATPETSSSHASSARHIPLPPSVSGAPGLARSVLGTGSVAPSDSVSQAGSKRSGRRAGSRASEVSERTVRAGKGGSGSGSERGNGSGSVKMGVLGLLRGM